MYTNFILNIIRLLRLHTKKICVTRKDDWNSSYSNSASVNQELVLSSLFCLANPGPNSEIVFDDEEEAPSIKVLKRACQGCDSIINSQSLNCVVGPGCW